MQWSAICMNLLGDGERDRQCASYLVTGPRGKMAAKEADKYCSVKIVDDTVMVDYAVARYDDWQLS